MFKTYIHGAGGYYEFYYQGELEGDDEDDYDAMIGGLYCEDPAHELFEFISGLEGRDLMRTRAGSARKR